MSFGKLSVSKPPSSLPTAAVEQAAEKKYRIINDKESVQGQSGSMLLGFPNRHHPDFKKAIVLNNVFGGFFGSRLMSNIRRDKGYTYGIHSYLQNHMQQSAWMISTKQVKMFNEATIHEVYEEMKKLRENIDEEELMLVRNFMIGTILGDLDGPFRSWRNGRTLY